VPHPNLLFSDIKYFSYSKRFDIYIERNLNCIMSIFIFLRFFFIFKYIIYRKHFLDTQMELFCFKNYFQVDINFAIRAFILEHPNKFVFILYSSFTYFYSFSFILFERNIPYSLINTYFDSIWFSLVDMHLIGYGDINVVSIEGRIMSVLACLTGCFVISLFICSVVNNLLFKSHELKQFELLTKINTDEEYLEKSKLLISKLLGKSKCKTNSEIIDKLNGFNEIEFIKNYENSSQKKEMYILNILKYLEDELHKMDHEEEIVSDSIFEMTKRLNNLYQKLI
jgi:hypothetical protein